MFIDLRQIIAKHNANIKGIIHVGAHKLEEYEVYKDCGINKVVWIEGNDDLIEIGKQKLQENNAQEQMLLNYLVYDQDDVELGFNITNNTESSSILQFGKHKQYYSYVDFVKVLIKTTKTLKSIIEENQIDLSSYNMLNLDLQGVELRALKGLGSLIESFNYVYTEINDDSIYIDNDYVADIDSYLSNYGFKRAETFMLSEKWGDALYIK
jgi:FkbM family methyltransferase